VASESSSRGSGWAQEGVVLREFRVRINNKIEKPLRVEEEQMILEAWHDLFAEKKLGWGFNLDNPNSPFFHVRYPL
jgi:hypothetical protein